MDAEPGKTISSSALSACLSVDLVAFLHGLFAWLPPRRPNQLERQVVGQGLEKTNRTNIHSQKGLTLAEIFPSDIENVKIPA
jgi:hypothetical protein